MTQSALQFEPQLEAYRLRVEEGIRQWTPDAETRPTRLHQAMRYSLEAGGKRLRPVLVLAAAEASGEIQADPIPAAVAVECLHTYSLIHDDLPCMDDADLRRGRPSSHCAFDEATALLAGDALLTEAFALLGRAYAGHPEVGMKLLNELGPAADSQHLIGGQMADLLAEAGKSTGVDDLHYIYENKTGALLIASLRMGAHLAGADERTLELVTRGGHGFGMAFQITDDLLDETGTEETTGKSVGRDAANDKPTWVAQYGVEQARKDAQRFCDESAAAFTEVAGPNGPTFLAELAQYIATRIT